jgi:ribonuclease BN (tRNA processing enzyme)
MNEPSNLFRITLLGTGAPPPRVDRFGPSTLVEVGHEKFIVDAGRGAMQRLHQLGIPFAAITGAFLTHHHSDHVVGFPDLWLTGWIGRPWGQRSTPLRVWGPEGTVQMMEHLPKAFAVDIRVRRQKEPLNNCTGIGAVGIDRFFRGALRFCEPTSDEMSLPWLISAPNSASIPVAMSGCVNRSRFC